MYLRGSAFGSYTGISWDRLPEEAFAGCPEPEAGLLVQSHTLEDSQTLSIRSRTYLPEIYTPYYLSQLPEVGVPRQDSGLQNRGADDGLQHLLWNSLLQSPQQRRCPTGLHHDRRLHPFFSSLQRVRPLYSGRGAYTALPEVSRRALRTSPKTPGSPTFLRRICPKPWRILSGIPLGMI